MAEVATSATSDQLLVVIDPVARQTDGESVRIVKDVLSAGAVTKVCLPEGPEEFARALARRGSRRPVVVGDDRALIRAVVQLHRQRDLAHCVLSVVPVGPVLGVARALGLPTGAVAASRAVLDGAERRLDLLVDDSDGVVLGTLRIPPLSVPEPAEAAEAGRHWLRTYQSLVRTLVAGPARPGAVRARSRPRPSAGRGRRRHAGGPGPAPGGGVGHPGLRRRPGHGRGTPAVGGRGGVPLLASGRTVTVTGADFRYRADTGVAGPVRRRTWVVREGALRLTVPR